LSEASSPTGAIRAIWDVAAKAKAGLRLVGWLLIVGLLFKYGWSYLGGSINLDQQIDRAVILIGFGVLLISHLIEQYQSHRLERYADITPSLHRVSHELRDLQSFLNFVSENERTTTDPGQFDMIFRKHIEAILDAVVTVFGIVTGTRCRAAVKLVHVLDQDRAYAYTFARDGLSKSASSDKKRHESRQDSIDENEDFWLIFRKQNPYFFSNDLTRRVHYTNTSFKVYGKPPEKKWWQSRFPAYSWTLPYRATIVWPIQQLESDSLKFETLGCIGFLAVDCPLPNRFREQSDVPLGAAIGDALYHCFVAWNALRLRIDRAWRSDDGQSLVQLS
jgi:hypothetical protein